MLQNLKPRDVLQTLFVVLGGWLLVILLEFFLARTFFPAFSLLTLGLIGIVLLFLIYRKLVINFQDTRDEVRNGIRQVQPLLFLHQQITLRKPLPPLRSYAASPDFLALLAEIVQELQPQTIVEAGSGVSTIVNGYLLEKQGSGKVYSLDHEAAFAEQTRNNIAKHGLVNFAEVLTAPLQTYTIQNQSWQWYASTALFSKIKSIDLLIVDGPPVHTQKHARYPALPLLLPYLSKNAVILVDDCVRAEDRESVQRWLRENSDFSAEQYYLEKGAFVLRRTK